MTAIGFAGATREQTLERLDAERFDCVVIGGGITGAGIAREAALRGASVALLEAVDFASGTSSRSSKLIHGGLRYLALGDVATVRQTALERRRIQRLAPHLAEPAWMLVPTRSRAGLAKLRVGLTTYEKLGSVDDADRHHNWGQAELAAGEPSLDRNAHPFACRYREYLTDDARLVLANLRAAAADGAAVLNHAPVDGILTEAGRAVGVTATCSETGRRLRVRGRALINAAGPWVDAVRALEEPSSAVRLHLSSGIHLVVRRETLPLNNVVILNAGDRRSIFAVPRAGIVYVGTTDTSHPAGHEHWPPIRGDDVDYLLAPMARYFPTHPVARSDVVAAWSGLRPLIADPGKPPAEIKRRDEVWIGPAGVVSIAGGKLTGYRPMARAAVEQAAEGAGLTLREAPEEDPPLPGGDFSGDLTTLEAGLLRETGLPDACAARLVRLYGAEARQVLALGHEPLCEDPGVRSGEVDWAVGQEGACQLVDLLYWRLRTALYDPDAREAVVEPAARRMGALLGWSETKRMSEIEAVRQRLAADLAFQKEDAT